MREEDVPYVVVKAGRLNGRVGGKREVMVLGACREKAVQKTGRATGTTGMKSAAWISPRSWCRVLCMIA